jgi:hypothetical protein
MENLEQGKIKEVEKAWLDTAEKFQLKRGTEEYNEAERLFFLGACFSARACGKPVAGWEILLMTGRPVV